MSQEESVVNRILQKHGFVDLILVRITCIVCLILFRKRSSARKWWLKCGPKRATLLRIYRKREGLRGWVNIMYGCDKFCTYCIVPYTRGKERNRRPEDVIAEVRELARQGYKEITPLGQNVNAYGKDFEDIEYRFGDLMDDIHKIDIPRVRFTTSHPRDFDDHLIEVLAKGGNLVEHIHLPVQSGSTQVLKNEPQIYA